MSELCSALHHLCSQGERFRFPFEAGKIPLNGIYVLFESGEQAHGGEKIVSTVSRCYECRPSDRWLGLYSPKPAIRRSGLWQEQGLYKTPLSKPELAELSGHLVRVKPTTLWPRVSPQRTQKEEKMLLESDVINAVCAELKSRGYHIQQKLSTTQQGDDIIAVKHMPVRCRLHIEAKGGTSSRKGSKRYGKPFSSAQVRVHVAEAFYKAAEILSRERRSAETRVGIALPDTRLHRKYMKNIQAVLDQLEVAIFWVESGGAVEVVSPWQI